MNNVQKNCRSGGGWHPLVINDMSNVSFDEEEVDGGTSSDDLVVESEYVVVDADGVEDEEVLYGPKHVKHDGGDQSENADQLVSSGLTSWATASISHLVSCPMLNLHKN